MMSVIYDSSSARTRRGGPEGSNWGPSRFNAVVAVCTDCGRRAATRDERRAKSVKAWARRHPTTYHDYQRWAQAH
jgi:hypothetical protein